MPIYRPKQRTLYIKALHEHEEEEGEEVHQNCICQECAGTGIGQHGDPDHSRCVSCRGTGMEQTE